MKRIIRLTESDLTRIVRRVLKESEDEFIDLDFEKSKKSNYIIYDYKREKKESKLKRQLVSPEGNIDPTNVQYFADLIYGYNEQNEETVIAKQNFKFKENSGVKDGTMSYNCNKDEIKYNGLGVVSERQKKFDKQWLSQWCILIKNWDSRVGKKKTLFRKFNPLLGTSNAPIDKSNIRN